jgi:hypothetical protein
MEAYLGYHPELGRAATSNFLDFTAKSFSFITRGEDWAVWQSAQAGKKYSHLSKSFPWKREIGHFEKLLAGHHELLTN